MNYKYSFKYIINTEIPHFWSRQQEKFWQWLAWNLPKRLVMWATVRLIAHATTGKYGNTIVPELTAMDALKRYIDDFGL